MSIRSQIDESTSSILEGDEHPDGVTSTVHYRCSVQELEEAGFRRGFSIRHIDEMPEHESEFVCGPAGQLSGIRDCLTALYRTPPRALIELVEMFDLEWASSPYDPSALLP